MYGADATLSVTKITGRITSPRLCGVIPAKAGVQFSAASPGVTGSPAFERVKKFQPHPEERPKGASRRMAASHCRASILRDALLRTAPQDEVLILHALFSRAMVQPRHP